MDNNNSTEEGRDARDGRLFHVPLGLTRIGNLLSNCERKDNRFRFNGSVAHSMASGRF
jgi:hypothetical protein